MLSGYRTEILILVEMLLFQLLASSYFLLLRVFAGVSSDGCRGFPIWDELVVSMGTVFGRAPFAAFFAFLFSASSFDLLLYSALAGSKIVSGIVDHSPAGFLI